MKNAALTKYQTMSTEELINSVKARAEELAQAERDEQAERDRRDDRARAVRLAGIQEKRDAERQQVEAQVDAHLEPEKTRASHEWLAAHPGKSPSDFEQVWKLHLRPSAVADMERTRAETTRARLRATHAYAM